MDSVVLLLLISMAWLYNENGLATSESAEYDEELQIPCGITTASTGIEFRITNRGTNSKYLEFPWMVALFIPKVKRRRCALADNRCWNFRCGGSLISSMVVLTTAQCIVDYKYGKIKVRAGDWNLDTLEEPLPYQERSVSKIIIHPQYYRGSRAKYRRYDAALLIVNSPYLLADNIGFICLPPPNHRMASTSCKFAGWGVQIFRTPGYQALLKVVDLNYLGHNQCQTTLRRNWFSRLRLHESSTCAGGVRGKGVCQGDGGGPLMCIEDDHYYARSISSWTVGCGLENKPSVFADVVKIRNWIDQEMTANGFSTDTYTHDAYYTDTYARKYK